MLLLDAGPGGTLSALLQRTGATDGPINFLGQRDVPISIFGLTLDFPVALMTVIAVEAWRYFPLAVLFVLRFIWTFKEFDDIFLLTGGAAGTRTLTVEVYEQAFGIANLGATSRISTPTSARTSRNTIAT